MIESEKVANGAFISTIERTFVLPEVGLGQCINSYLLN